MNPGALRLGPPVQIAHAVPDAIAAAHRWTADLGAGPFFVNEHIELVDVTYRGRPAEFDHTSAYGQWGAIMVELVQDHGRGPSIVRDRFGPDESGLHHVAFIVDDLGDSVRHLAARGHEIAMTASTAGGTRFRFVDTMAWLGHFVELYERSDRIERFYAMVADAAEEWDGSDPLRYI